LINNNFITRILSLADMNIISEISSNV